MLRAWLVTVVFLLLSAFAMAQSSSRVEVFGGYTYMRPDFSLASPNSASGWNASANFKAWRRIGFVADFSGFYPSYSYPQGASVSGKAFAFLFGPQVSFPHGRFSPFTRFLIGAAHVTPQNIGGTSYNFFRSNNALSLAAGGGLDYSVARHIAIRGQVDWLYAKLTPLGGGDPGVNYVKNRSVARISTGVVFRF